MTDKERIDRLERVAEAASIALGSSPPWGTDKEAIDSQIVLGKALDKLKENDDG